MPKQDFAWSTYLAADQEQCKKDCQGKEPCPCHGAQPTDPIVTELFANPASNEFNARAIQPLVGDNPQTWGVVMHGSRHCPRDPIGRCIETEVPPLKKRSVWRI